MSSTTFPALWITETAEGAFQRQIIERSTDDLPRGDVLVKVSYSALNYKDALSASGNKGVTRHFPHTPGIDAAGVVAASDSADFPPGTEVIVTSYDLGMNTSGGFGGYIRVPAHWVVPLPAGLSLQESMILGTAGLTAAISVHKLRHAGVTPDKGEILVTGASGGVGCLGVAILARLGYTVIAGTGKPGAQDWLRGLGAKGFVRREALLDTSGKPLLKPQWAGVLDTVGGEILATALKTTQSEGAIACCGNVASIKLPTTVFPFILRGINLLGVDSQNYPMAQRRQLWDRLASDWQPANLASIMTATDLTTLKDNWIDAILNGQVQGRIVVAL